MFTGEALISGGPFSVCGQSPEQNMIQLTRLNNHPLVVNSDLIKFVEQAPDTVITLLSGEKIVVRESAQDVLERVVQFRRSVLQEAVPGPESGCAAQLAGAESKAGNSTRNDTRNDIRNDASYRVDGGWSNPVDGNNDKAKD
jgi:flagellar protein FlbD